MSEPMSSGGATGAMAMGAGALIFLPVKLTTSSASCVAMSKASTNVTIWGANTSAFERQSPPCPAPGLHTFAAISMMIRFAPQHPQAIVLSRQTDMETCALVLPIDDPYKGRQCPILNPNALTTGALDSR